LRIKVEGITKSYKGKTALNNVNFSCNDGEFFSVLGEAGSGKSTLLRIIAGLEKPDQGKIYFNEQDIEVLPAHQRFAVMVFQNRALFPHLNVFDNVAYGLREQKMAEAEIRHKVLDMLKILHIDDVMFHECHELTLDEQQRVAIARALVVKARVVMFDEPFANMDTQLRKNLQKELRTIQKETKRTFIFVTPDQEEALMLSDKLMILEKGEVCELGSPIQVYEFPKTRYGASFLGYANVLDAERLDKQLLKTKGGLLFQHDEDLQGKYFDLVVRPEHITPAQKNTSGNVFKAKVAERYFKGSTFEYLLDIEGTQVKMFAPEDLGSEALVVFKKYTLFKKT
jgi:spermidine/putrescine transport system ATP-binding protein